MVSVCTGTMINEKHKLFYNTVLSQIISDCGEYLFVGTNFGDILVFSIPQICGDSYGDGSAAPKPLQIFNASETEKIWSLAFHRGTLIVGTTSITGYEWCKNRLQKQSWQIQLRAPSGNSNCADQQNDINSLSLVGDVLYAGCGDNLIYQINLEDGQILRNFEGHDDFINGVSVLDDVLYSASQDGTVRIWDQRAKRASHILKPFKDDKLARPNLGKWQGIVNANSNWLVCGGGPRPALFHLRSLQCSTIYAFNEKVRVGGFVDDRLYIAGDDKKFNVFTINGDIDAEIITSSSNIYSVVMQTAPNALISIGGTSNCLDLCSNLQFKNSILKLYE